MAKSHTNIAINKPIIIKTMTNDNTTTISDIQKTIMAFVDARDWRQFHSLKNLAMAVGSETGELMAHFRWHTDQESNETMNDPDKRNEITSEVADIAMLLFEFAHAADIDITKAINDKLKLNESRYPVDKAKGCNKKYNEI